MIVSAIYNFISIVKNHIHTLFFFKFNQKPISLDPIFDTYTQNGSLCDSCKEIYHNLTSHFKTLGLEKNICMDVMDLVCLTLFLKIQFKFNCLKTYNDSFNLFQFNYTRITWSKGYKCNYRDIDEVSVVIISVTTILVTILFYVSVRVCNKTEKTKLLNKCKLFLSKQIS